MATREPVGAGVVKPSPYVSIYMGRRQAEEALKALRWMADGKAKSNPLWAAIKVIEKAMSR